MPTSLQVPIIKLGLFDLLALVWSACDEVVEYVASVLSNAGRNPKNRTMLYRAELEVKGMDAILYIIMVMVNMTCDMDLLTVLYDHFR